MSSNAVVTSAGGLATDPAVAWVAIQATIVLTSVFTGWTSGLVAHAWTVGASAAAVDASMLGHAAASFAWKSAQKLWRPADIEAEADPDGSSEAAMDGSTDGAADSTLGRGAAVASTEGAALEPVDEHAAKAIAATARSARTERRMDMMTSKRVGSSAPSTVAARSCRPAVWHTG